MTNKKQEKETEQDRREEALEALAILGGKLTTEDDITFSGTRFILPQHLDLTESIDFLSQRRDDEENEFDISRTFNYRPMDGAIATAKAIKKAFGVASGKTLYSFFGKHPPEFINIEVGPHGEMAQAPWGAISLPLEGATLYLGNSTDRALGNVFEAMVRAPRKWRWHIDGFFKLIQHYLETESIYRGKAIDGEGHFIDTAVVDPTRLVYTHDVQRRLEGDLWAFIRYESQLASEGQDGKYAVLLHGPYGSGKTEAAGVTAQIANDHGWTFLMCRPGQDDLRQALQMARLYPPAVVFAEDVDVRAGAGALDINQSLDMMDGFHTKGQKLIVVFTTNHVEKIHKGMLRPGRIGAIIKIAEMDRAGVEKLARRVVGENLAPDVDFDAVYAAVSDYMPAFVKESLNRSIRYSISDNGGKIGLINTDDLLTAANGLRDQLDLMNGAKVQSDLPRLDTVFQEAIRYAVNGVQVHSDEEGEWGHLAI